MEEEQLTEEQNADANAETDEQQTIQTPAPQPETRNGLSEFSIGKFTYRGPFGIAVALLIGLILGGGVISFSVYSNKPATLVGLIANHAILTAAASTPTQTPVPPPPPETVEVIKTVEVEVVKEVEVTRPVEIEKEVIVTVEVIREVEVEKIVTQIVEVTPLPLSLPEILESRILIAFQEAGNYVMSGDPFSLSSIWVGRDNLEAEVNRLRTAFTGIDFAEWKVNDSSILLQEEGYEVYTLSLDTTLTISGSYGCSGERIRDTIDISYPGLVRAEIQNPNLGIVRIYSWTNARIDSVTVELCSTNSP